jgi:hypothetical protein
MIILLPLPYFRKVFITSVVVREQQVTYFAWDSFKGTLSQQLSLDDMTYNIIVPKLRKNPCVDEALYIL